MVPMNLLCSLGVQVEFHWLLLSDVSRFKVMAGGGSIDPHVIVMEMRSVVRTIQCGALGRW